MITLEDLRKQLLALIPEDSELFTRVSNATNEMDIVWAVAELYGTDRSKWESFVPKVEAVWVTHAHKVEHIEQQRLSSSDEPTAIKKWLLSSVGKRFDGDGQFGAQCKDFANAYAQWLGHPLQPGDAAQVWHDTQDPYWQKIPHTQSFVPQLGDIVVWDARKASPYGHVAVVLEANAESFTSVDQNWHNSNLETGSPAALITHTYLAPDVLGYLRPSL